jgi:hypothetical protein
MRLVCVPRLYFSVRGNCISIVPSTLLHRFLAFALLTIRYSLIKRTGWPGFEPKRELKFNFHCHIHPANLYGVYSGAVSSGIKATGAWRLHSPPFSAMVKNTWIFMLVSTVHLHGPWAILLLPLVYLISAHDGENIQVEGIRYLGRITSEYADRC